jgi:hypothetical protein
MTNHEFAGPAALIPRWAAELVFVIDDNVSDDARAALAVRFSAAIRGTATWTPGQWEAVRVAVRVGILDLAAPCVTTDEWGVRDAIAAVRAALVAGEGLEAAREAARAAAAAADAAAGADAAYYAACAASADAAYYAVSHAAADATAADAAYAVAGATAGDAWAAYRAARSAAWGRIADVFLAALEAKP